jgi:hypothetical protein
LPLVSQVEDAVVSEVLRLLLDGVQHPQTDAAAAAAVPLKPSSSPKPNLSLISAESLLPPLPLPQSAPRDSSAQTDQLSVRLANEEPGEDLAQAPHHRPTADSECRPPTKRHRPNPEEEQ